MTDDDDQADTVTTPAPLPLIAGSFAIYQGPRQEIVLVTEIEGRGVERRVFPWRTVRLFAGPIMRTMSHRHTDHTGEPWQAKEDGPTS